MKTTKYLLPLIAILLAQPCMGQRSAVPPEFAPPVLLMIDTDATPLSIEQQRERLRIAKELRPTIKDTVIVLGYTKEEIENRGIDGIYYDYMAECANAYNVTMRGLDEDAAATLLRLTALSYGRPYYVEWCIGLQYFHLNDNLDFVFDLTPGLAQQIGFSDEAFAVTNEFFVADMENTVEMRREAAECGISWEAVAASYKHRSPMFFTVTGCGENGCYEPQELKVAFERINAKYGADTALNL